MMDNDCTTPDTCGVCHACAMPGHTEKDCPSKASDRSELIKLRTGLARLAQKAGIGEYIPGSPAREAPFEVIAQCAEKHERGWNALIAHLMDKVEAPEPFSRHEPGCESWQGKLCSCSPYSMEG